MTHSSFLARKTLGQPRYLLLAMACVFVLALVPGGARRALDSSSLDAAGWLPNDYREKHDLAWFRDHFRGEDFALVSWDGCTLGDDEQLELLAKKLSPGPTSSGEATLVSERARRDNWYARVVAAPQILRELMANQSGLAYGAAVKRLEGALVGPPRRDAQGRSLGDDSRAACLVVYLSPSAMSDRRLMCDAVNGISQIAAAECGIDPATIHMGGPPVDYAQIDAESDRTLVRLASVVGILGIGLCFWRLGSVRLSTIVVSVGVISAGLSLAIVFYFGVFEVLALGHRTPDAGTLDAILMAMPAVVYLLAISAAIHAVNYYLEVRREHGVDGAVETAVRQAFRPSLLAALATAAGLATLAASDVVPMQKFALFTAAAIVASPAVLFSVLPVLLHRFPLSDASIWRRIARRETSRLAGPSQWLFRFVVNHRAATFAACTIAMLFLGAGVTRIDASVQLLKLLDRRSDLISDYAWLQANIGNLVPVEVVVTMPPERLRSEDEHAEQDGQQYRLTMLERIELLREIERRLEEFPQISRALSAATFTPPSTRTGLAGANRGGDFVKNKALESSRERLLAGDYLRMEREPYSDRQTGRELWRLTARVAAPTTDNAGVDFDDFLGQMRRAVEPVLLACQQRDLIVRALHEQGKQLAGSHVCVLFRAPDGAAVPPPAVQEKALADLLSRSGVAPRGVSYYNLATFERPGRGNEAQDQLYRQSALNSLRQQDAVILASAASDPAAHTIAQQGVYVLDVSRLPSTAETIATPLADDGGPRPLRAVMTGVAPVIAQTQRLLLATLRYGLSGAVAAAALVVTVGLMSIPAGLLAMIPSLLTLTALFGSLGWLGIKVDLGITMTAAVALGLALEGTIHFIAWFRRSRDRGVARRDAVLHACHRCGPALIETALIGGLGLTVLGFSSFAPIREFGVLIPAALAASLVGNLLILPTILASPLGWFFASAAVRHREPLWEMVKARRSGQPAATAAAGPRLPHMSEQLVQTPHFVDDPQPVRRTLLHGGTDERRELADGPHAALHARLQQLRRPRAGDSAAS